MPTSTIPYDPSLVLGMIVDPSRIAVLEKIAQAQLPVDLARDHVNALLRQKLSLDMTARELLSLGVEADALADFRKNVDDLMKNVVSAAIDLGSKVVTAEQAIVQVKTEAGQSQIGTQLQSPVDFSASKLTAMPISSDSMNMDVQYFRYESNQQASQQATEAVSSFVGSKVSEFLGPTFGASAAASTNKSMTAAQQNHAVMGTLVICANCTSRQAQIFSPLVLDVDAAIDSYNKQASDKMPVEAPNAMKQMALTNQDDDPTKSLCILIGASYGSSFVGFVHFAQSDATSSSQTSESDAFQARAQADDSLLLANITGTWGMDAQSASSLKNLLSSTNIDSHCSVITMGLIPSIKSNQVITSVKALQGDPKSDMESLAALQDSTNGSNVSIAAGAAAARKGEAMSQMKSDYIKAAVDAVADVDTTTNQVIDLNSLQVALDDYIAKASDGQTGVPINFYLKYVTKRDIAHAWLEKYYPAMLRDPEAAGGGAPAA